jgi:23S rRNA (adenine2030-N6)-methyltransferase
VNYRHAFHAGNFADVFKHALLTRILVYLTKKAAPFCFIDSHAGAGAYDLAGAEASRSGEWRLGVARLKDAEPPPDVAALLAPYLQALGPLDAAGRPARYPGSPALAQALLRRQDRLSLCELHDEERAALIAAMGRDSRLSIVGLNGYVALRAFVPPKERRGLVLIDPPYEASDEAERVTKALATALGKWPTGTYAHWRPIKDRREDANFLNGVAALGVANILAL